MTPTNTGAVSKQKIAPEPKATPAGAPTAVPATKSDDEILGLAPAREGNSNSAPSTSPGAASGEESAASEARTANQGTPADPEQYRGIFESNPELRDAWREAQAFRETFPTAEDARAAGSQVATLDALDALFFSNRPEAHAELAASVYRLNPEAFRNLARMMTAIASDSGHAADTAGRLASNQSPATQGAAALPAGAMPANTAQQEFFHDTNAAVVEGVLQTIESQLSHVLPEGTPKGTRERVVGEVYRQLEAGLRSNRGLTQQLRQAFRSGAPDAQNQRAIVSLVVNRARQALPGVTKKVLNEWTSGVVAASSERAARQKAAESRIEIAGTSPSGDGRRALMPRDLDYRRLSDADILNL